MDELVDERVLRWLSQLEARHMADLRVAEVTRALRALSSAYVERRSALARGAALDSAGKRAAFALFYGPLHFFATCAIVHALGLRAPRTIVDIGCGTGAAGAAWAVATGRRARLSGIDRHPWAVEEARWTYRQLGLDGTAKQGDASRSHLPRAGFGIVAGYVLNELPDAVRQDAWRTLLSAAQRGSPVLVIEPISRAAAPWWDTAAAEAAALGGRTDEWRIPMELPPLLALLDRSAGLNHRELKARSLLLPGDARSARDEGAGA